MEKPVISVSQLRALAAQGPVVLVDCRFSLAVPEWGRQQYEQHRLPGAHYLHLNEDLSSPEAEHGGRHPLPELQNLAETLQRLGVCSGPVPTPVVVYDDNRGAFASRLWWLLRFLGHDEVAVLDGGFEAWREAGEPALGIEPLSRGDFTASPRWQWVMDYDEVAALSRRFDQGEAIALVDSREAERYQGLQEPIDPVAGHIPGAINFPWPEVTAADGRFKPADFHRERWRELGDEAAVAYCGSGVTACVNLLSMALAGRQGDRLYVGSWSDWCSYL